MGTLRQEREQNFMDICAQLLFYVLKDQRDKQKDDSTPILTEPFFLRVEQEDGSSLIKFEIGNAAYICEKQDDGTYKVSLSLLARIIPS